jgi:molybdopterin-guanine dinucleotide biosynthesis protein A
VGYRSQFSDPTGHNGFVNVAGMLLTGGASRRLGVDKPGLDVGEGSLAQRTAGLLRSVAAPAVEVGRGYSDLPLVADPEPGQGPLAAVAFGWAELRRLSCSGPTLVVATDLPFLSEGLLRWLAGHPSGRSVIPFDGEQLQPLCARYEAGDLDLVAGLYRAGARSMRDLTAAIEPLRVQPAEWQAAAGHALALLDVDTPADLQRARQAGAVRPGRAGGGAS